jgi:ATP-dependent exoDNAse (exonuclease V) beta subunit
MLFCEHCAASLGGFDVAELPEFDEERHAALPGELKLLYVAVTRAKANL